jgi:hypothetical protein
VPSPVDRRRPGSKHHLITDAHGFPLAVTLTGGHHQHVTQLIPLVEAIWPAAAATAPSSASGAGHTRPALGWRHGGAVRRRPPAHGPISSPADHA